MRLVTGLLLCVLLFPGLLRAQGSRVRVTLLPRVGLLTQAVPFQREFTDLPPEYHQVWRYRIQPDVVLGLAADIATASLPVGVRIEASHAPSLVIEQEGGSLGPDVFDEASGSGTMTTATVAAIVQPARTCMGVVCPRLLVGGGVKQYRFDTELLSGDIVFPLAEDQARLTLQLGAGVVARRKRVSLVAEVNDYSNKVALFQDTDDPRRRVHDTIATLGIALQVR